jgi:hypothetical protein
MGLKLSQFSKLFTQPYSDHQTVIHEQPRTGLYETARIFVWEQSSQIIERTNARSASFHRQTFTKCDQCVYRWKKNLTEIILHHSNTTDLPDSVVSREAQR